MPNKKELLYVLIQLVLFVLYLFDLEVLRFDVPGFVRGFVLGFGVVSALLVLMSLIQLNTNLSPFPSPREESKLMTTGAFKFTRHPIYTGIFCALLCYGIAYGSGFKIAVGVLLLILFHYKSLYEEKLLLEKFPEYSKYQTETGRLFPRF